MNDLDARLAPFVAAGLISQLPTRWQLLQAELQMAPYVISTDATLEARYRRTPLANPLVRQPLILAHVGLDHLRTGTALSAKLESLCRHLALTYHQGMPVFDLQVVQTHPDGLAQLRASTEDVLAGATRRGRRLARVASWIMQDAPAYHRRFLGDDGWIARAERFDYPAPDSEGSAFPAEFYSLVGLVNYAARAFPRRVRDVALHRYPDHLARVATRRFREGAGFGWFTVPAAGCAR